MPPPSPEIESPSVPDDGLPPAEVSYPGLVLPVVSAVLGLTGVFFFYGGDATLELFTTAVATATVAGKFIVLRGLHEGGLFDSPYKLAFLIIYLDLMVALIAVYNIGILYRIPRLGKKIQAMQKSGRRILERNPWMRKVTFLGIIAFVMFPLSGTGAIGGALFGRLLGMSRLRTIGGIAIGAAIGGFGMAWLATVFGSQMEALQGNPIFLVGGLLVMGLVVWRLVKNSKRSAEAAAQEADATGPIDARAELESSDDSEAKDETADEHESRNSGGVGVETRPRSQMRPKRGR